MEIKLDPDLGRRLGAAWLAVRARWADLGAGGFSERELDELCVAEAELLAERAGALTEVRVLLTKAVGRRFVCDGGVYQLSPKPYTRTTWKGNRELYALRGAKGVWLDADQTVLLLPK